MSRSEHDFRLRACGQRGVQGAQAQSAGTVHVRAERVGQGPRQVSGEAKDRRRADSRPRRRAGDRRGARASARDRVGQGFGGGVYDRSVADRGALRLGGGGGDRRRLRSLRADDGRGLHGRERYRRVEGRNRRISLTGL